uniref:Uncharacterized protein n=1 Tax=Branchiostoma floridae TaxID=7739 RepID=C3Z807_BRAFL|eukprot:XP_002595309.1 hypothetical protein BRAFLDRAFT_87539 [Branchiostoma floridae]
MGCLAACLWPLVTGDSRRSQQDGRVSTVLLLVNIVAFAAVLSTSSALAPDGTVFPVTTQTVRIVLILCVGPGLMAMMSFFCCYKNYSSYTFMHWHCSRVFHGMTSHGEATSLVGPTALSSKLTVLGIFAFGAGTILMDIFSVNAIAQCLDATPTFDSDVVNLVFHVLKLLFVLCQMGFLRKFSDATFHSAPLFRYLFFFVLAGDISIWVHTLVANTVTQDGEYALLASGILYGMWANMRVLGDVGGGDSVELREVRDKVHQGSMGRPSENEVRGGQRQREEQAEEEEGRYQELPSASVGLPQAHSTPFTEGDHTNVRPGATLGTFRPQLPPATVRHHHQSQGAPHQSQGLRISTVDAGPSYLAYDNVALDIDDLVESSVDGDNDVIVMEPEKDDGSHSRPLSPTVVIVEEPGQATSSRMGMGERTISFASNVAEAPSTLAARSPPPSSYPSRASLLTQQGETGKEPGGCTCFMAGFLISALLLVLAILLKDQTNYDSYIIAYFVVKIFVTLTMIAACWLGFQTMERYEFVWTGYGENDALLVIAAIGFFVYDYFGFASAFAGWYEGNGDDYRRIIAPLLFFDVATNMIQVWLQVTLLITAIRRRPVFQSLESSGVFKFQVWTYLIITNVGLWVLNSFIDLKDADTTPVQYGYYGEVQWYQVTRFVAPLCIFFRFMSALSSWEIYSTYRGQRDDSSSRDGDSMDTESFEIRFDVENDCIGSCQGPAAMAKSEGNGNGRNRSKKHLPESQQKALEVPTKADVKKKGRRWSSRSVGEDFRRKLFAGGNFLDS